MFYIFIKGRFCKTIASLVFLTPEFNAISSCRQRRFSHPVNTNKQSRKSYPEGQTLALCKRKVVCKRSYVLIMNEEDKSKLTSGGFCLLDSGSVVVIDDCGKYERNTMPSPRLLNQINEIHETEL